MFTACFQPNEFCDICTHSKVKKAHISLINQFLSKFNKILRHSLATKVYLGIFFKIKIKYFVLQDFTCHLFNLCPNIGPERTTSILITHEAIDTFLDQSSRSVERIF
jgi:hypothetical protein